MIDRIYELCKQAGINGNKLAELLELKKTPLTDWKNGKSKPTAEQIIKMCDIFAVSADYILFGKEHGDLTLEEQELINAYQASPEPMKAAVRKLLDIPQEKVDISTYNNGKEAI